MIEYQTIYTILIGSSIGFAYGLFFGHTQKRALCVNTYSLPKTVVHVLLNAVARISLLSICGFYLLHLAKIHFILLIITFVITFWIMIFNR